MSLELTTDGKELRKKLFELYECSQPDTKMVAYELYMDIVDLLDIMKVKR